MKTPPKTAFCTIVVGKPYQDAFDRYCRGRFERYAARHGYDPIILTEPVRELPGRKFTWQKLCLPDLPWWRDYEQVAFIDADILIARDAPPLPIIAPGKIGGVPDKLPYQINSGVLVYHPDEAIKALFDEALLDEDPFWDQRALTRVMLYRNMEKLIDARFNRQFYFKCWTLWSSLFRRQWFYHACHGKIKMPFIHAWLRLTFR
ncbi:MAG: hypothetical protein JJT96_09000 [Opitutales bacterium]|nr:hypothetical protein [Opitutales bacterium]